MIRNTSLFLHVGDRVYHKNYLRWGEGVVVEERASELPGGFCYVRIDFQDGKVRVFDNNYKSECCCYYAGIEKIEGHPKYIEVDDDDEIEEEKKPTRKRKALPKAS
jgi:hypothetical protein